MSTPEFKHLLAKGKSINPILGINMTNFTEGDDLLIDEEFDRIEIVENEIKTYKRGLDLLRS